MHIKTRNTSFRITSRCQAVNWTGEVLRLCLVSLSFFLYISDEMEETPKGTEPHRSYGACLHVEIKTLRVKCNTVKSKTGRCHYNTWPLRAALSRFPFTHTSCAFISLDCLVKPPTCCGPQPFLI